MDQQIIDAMKEKNERAIQLLLKQYGGLIKSIIQNTCLAYHRKQRNVWRMSSSLFGIT